MKRSALLITIASIALCAGAGEAGAAVSVVGNGLAHSCYDAAEYGGDPRSAVETCNTALGQAALSIADRAATYVNRGILQGRLGDTQAALADYNESIRLRADLAEAYVDRGAIMIAMDRDADAAADLSRGIELGAKRPQVAYYDRAIVREKMGNIRGAYDDYKMAITLEPGFTLASQQLQRFRVIRKDSGA